MPIYKVLVVDDQISTDAIMDAFERDRALGSRDEPALELHGHALNRDDAIGQLEYTNALPDAILLDDYLPSHGQNVPSALDIMAWLFKRCQSRRLPQPRVTLWTGVSDPQLAYSFCWLGGMQVVDKRQLGLGEIPVRAIWQSLSGIRWQPDPYPDPRGLQMDVYRAALPWIEGGYQPSNLHGIPELRELGASERTWEGIRRNIQKMPLTQEIPTPTAAIAAAKANGWVWVPLRWQTLIRGNGAVDKVIDPTFYKAAIGYLGPLPARAGAYAAERTSPISGAHD